VFCEGWEFLARINVKPVTFLKTTFLEQFHFCVQKKRPYQAVDRTGFGLGD